MVRFLVPRCRQVVISDRLTADQLGPALTQLTGIPATYRLGSQDGGDLLDCDEVFVSPGVPPSEPVVSGPRNSGIPISSATGLFLDLCQGPIIGVTGSCGKTTTSSLVAAMLTADGIDVRLGGNIGVPMLGKLDAIGTATWSVLELSSFQLAELQRSPHVASVLNIFPDHLDRHLTFDDYVSAKLNIIRHQDPSDLAILNADDSTVASVSTTGQRIEFSLEHPVRGAWLEAGDLYILGFSDGHFIPGQTRRLLARAEIPLLGAHNVANVLAASCLARGAGCGTEAISSAVRAFTPVAHRLEVVRRIDSVTYVNDSIATTPQRSMAALLSFDAPIVLIAGGRDKRVPMAEWGRLIAERARAVVLVGEAAPLIRAALEAASATLPIVLADHFGDTVRLAEGLAHAGDVVLLAPGCTSFDQFRDYQARGEAFRAAVSKLAAPRDT